MDWPVIEVDERNGGCGVIFEGQLYVWGGNTVDRRYPYQEVSDSDSSDDSDEEDGGIDPNMVIETVVTLPRPRDPAHPFDVFDLTLRTWGRQPTSGNFPSLGLGSSLVVHHPSRSFFLYGGFNEFNFDSEVYKISTDSWVWEIVHPATKVKPSPRYLTGVVVHKDRLCMFGGVGLDIVKDQDPGASYKAKEEGNLCHYGWNNEYYEFNLNSSSWVASLGPNALRPSPIGTFAFSKFDQRRALMFGGSGSQGRTNEVFIIDLEDRVWMGPLKPSSPAQMWPAVRRFATLTPLIDPELVGERLCGCGPVLRQRLLLLWGKDSQHHICNETWILDTGSFTWTLLNIGLKPRSWHVAQPLHIDMSTECQVAIFGGNIHVEGHYGDRLNTADVQVLQFGVKTLVNSCLSVIVGSEEVMAAVPSLPTQVQTQVHAAYQAHLNGPPILVISHAL